MKPRFFKTQGDFRAWLETHGATAKELWIGYYKKESGKGGLVYRQALDEALCFGWIDGVVKRIDASCYMQRWTPRTRTSSWSLVNTKRVGELMKLGVMAAPGIKAFKERDLKRSGIYLYEQSDRALDPKLQRAFKANKTAWAFFKAQPPGYRRLAIMYIMTAKKEETRQKRFDGILKASAAKTRTRWM